MLQCRLEGIRYLACQATNRAMQLILSVNVRVAWLHHLTPKTLIKDNIGLWVPPREVRVLEATDCISVCLK